MATRAMLIQLTFLGACSTTGTYREPSAEQAVATVLGVSRSVLSGLNPLGESPDVRIVAVDGDSLSKSGWSGYPDAVRVALCTNCPCRDRRWSTASRVEPSKERCARSSRRARPTDCG